MGSRTRHHTHRRGGSRGLLGGALVALALGAAASPAAALETVPQARPAEAARIGSSALAALAARQGENGHFQDATGRPVGGGGLPSIAWVALRQATQATSKEERAWRLQLARRTLAAGSGTSVILSWPLAMTVASDLGELVDHEREDLRRRVRGFGAMHAAGIADRCYRRPSCFNNYKLASAVMNLELTRSGVRSKTKGTRLYRPAATRRSTIAWLGGSLPRVAPATGVVAVPGQPAQRAAILSDPTPRPLAYHALCTAWAVRATALLGRSAPRGLRTLTRQALWGLLGVAAPNGELSWSGRGQDQIWTLGAALYAAAAGARQFANTDPVLAQRLRRLADIELRALGQRLDAGGALGVLPSGNRALSGLDHYYSATGSTGLALLWLELARAELPAPGAPRKALPSEVDRSTFSDAATTGLLTRRWGRTWMGLRMRRDHAFDPRQDFGLLRALRRRGGTWTEQRVARPRALSTSAGRSAQKVPTGGPVLVRGSQRLTPRAWTFRPVARGVELVGEWRSAAGHRMPGRWRFTTSGDGVSLGTPCPRGDTVELTEWLPRQGVARRSGRSIARGGFRLGFAPGGRVRELSTTYANARQPGLRAYRVAVPCGRPWLQARWSGNALAGA